MVFVILGFLARHIRSVGALLGLELQENVIFISWKTLNKGSIWFPFSRIWFLRARIRCHGSVFWKLGVHFPIINSTLQQKGCTFEIWVKTDSDLFQSWFRSDSKLIQIWFETDSRLNWVYPPTLSVMCAEEMRLCHFQTDSTLNLVAPSPLLSCMQWRGGSDISRLIQHWIWLPFTLPVMCAEIRRSWLFQTDSTLNLVAL